MKHPRFALTALGLAIALGTLGCSSAGDATGGESASESAPHVETLDETSVEDFNLPASYEGRTVMETEWHQPPEEIDGVFIGERLVGEPGEEIIVVVAVDASGTILWTVEGPPVVLCSGTLIHANYTADGVPTVVITDVTSTAGSIVTPVISAYEVHGGEQVWGPVEVPGFRLGPGLVFENTKNLSAGKDVAKIVLDASTGEVLADGMTLQDRRIVGESSGTLFTVDDTTLFAESLNDDGTFDTVWSVSLAERGWDADEISSRRHMDDFGGKYLAIPSGDGVADIISLDTGDIVLADTQQVKYDHQSGALLAVTGNRVFGVQPGAEPWSFEVDEAVFIQGAGDGLGYLQGVGTLHVVDLRTGEARAPEFVDDVDAGSIQLLPTVISSNGAAVIEGQELRFFVAAPST